MEAIMKNILNNVTRHIALRRMADFFEKVERNPVTRTPKEVGLDYEDVSFKSLDGVNLKGWYIPSEKSAYSGENDHLFRTMPITQTG
jgi:hypothetical protein